MSTDPPISRRNFLRGRLGAMLSGVGDVAHDSSSTDQKRSDSYRDDEDTDRKYDKTFPILRPPGAVDEERFLAECTRCNACIEACPHDAILVAPDRFRRAAGTPMIDPMRQPCWMCADAPCITACEPGVLQRELGMRLGAARISPVTCLAHQKSFCTVCSEQCHVPGAIEIIQGKPRIVEDVCTGCGVCQYVCPAPENAILLTPADRTHSPEPVENNPAPGRESSPDKFSRPPAPWEIDLLRDRQSGPKSEDASRGS